MSEEVLLVGGWREVSLVDVLGHVSFTVWLARCNLKCPWCSNAELAKGVGARYVRVSEILEALEKAKAFIDVLHVTGGEPLLQHRALLNLFQRVRSQLNLPISLDTNGTHPKALERLAPLLYHLAIDVKAPLSDPQLYAKVTGVSLRLAERVVKDVAASIGIGLSVPFLELRTTLVPGLLTCDDAVRIAEELEELTRKATGRVIYVVQQFIPYEGVKGDFARRPATPAKEVADCARRVTVTTSLETYYRTLEEGTRKP
ncbi:MAG: anaerobic ribonucleoside-triphosphate reductase activating protein [Thermofilaceae archaeon]